MIDTKLMMELEDQLGVRDSIVAFCGKQRENHDEKVERFVVAMAEKYPWARVVVGDTSLTEKAAKRAAEMCGLRTTVISNPRKAKGAKQGEWFASPQIRDERIVSEATDLVILDQSQRCKEMEKLANRMSGKRVWRI